MTGPGRNGGGLIPGRTLVAAMQSKLIGSGTIEAHRRVARKRRASAPCDSHDTERLGGVTAMRLVMKS